MSTFTHGGGKFTFDEWRTIENAVLRRRKNVKKFLKRLKKNRLYWSSQDEPEEGNDALIKETSEKVVALTTLIKKIRAGYFDRGEKS